MPRSYAYHDARTGEFVSEEYAQQQPNSTVRIERKPNLDLATPMELLQELWRRSSIEANRRNTWLTTPPTED